MALTITEKARGSLGGRAMRVFAVTHDDSTTTVDASSMGLNYIETAWFSIDTLTSAPAATLCMAVTGSALTFSEALKTASIVNIGVIGY